MQVRGVEGLQSQSGNVGGSQNKTSPSLMLRLEMIVSHGARLPITSLEIDWREGGTGVGGLERRERPVFAAGTYWKCDKLLIKLSSAPPSLMFDSRGVKGKSSSKRLRRRKTLPGCSSPAFEEQEEEEEK